MKFTKFASYAVAAAVLSMPLAALSQESHEDAKAQVDAHNKKHHTKAKIVGGSAAGGAATGAVVAGPAGAVVGAGIGAGAGLVGHKIHKKHEDQEKGTDRNAVRAA